MKEWFINYGGFWGSVIGGLGGGVLTYFGVLLTLKVQKKSEYTKKLLTLTEMIFVIENYQRHLAKLLVRIYKNQNNIVESFKLLDLDDLKLDLILKAVTVDIETYEFTRNAFQKYFKLNYDEVAIYLIENYKTFDANKRAAEGLIKELPILVNKIANKIAWYEEKLK